MYKSVIHNYKILLFIILIPIRVFAQTITHDSEDNILLFNSFYGKLQFINSDTIGSWTENGNGFFLTKIDTGYNIIWNKHLLKNTTSFYSNEEFPIATDNLNNIITAGSFYDTIWYDSIHYSVLPGESYNHAFCVKFSSDGDFLWSLTPLGRTSYISSVTVDELDNLYISGGGGDTLQFLPLPPMINDRNFGFVVKISSEGIPIWQKQIYTTSAEPYHGAGCSAITIADNGKLFVTGGFNAIDGMATLHVDSDTTTSNFDKTEVFILAIDTLGELLWLKDLNCTGEFNYPNEIVASDSFFITGGTFQGAISTPPAGNLSTDLMDSYVAKFDNNGNANWSGQGCADCGSNSIWLFGLDNDTLSNIYTTGTFYDKLSIDGFPVFNSPVDGISYIVKYNIDGIPECVYTNSNSYFNISVAKTQQICLIDHLDFPILKGTYDAGMILSILDASCNLLYFDTIAWYIDQPLQIDENTQAVKMNIYPNPAEDILTVLIPGYQNEEKHYSIYNSTGQLIESGILMTGDQILKLNIRDIPKGFYILEIISGSASWTGKFLKK